MQSPVTVPRVWPAMPAPQANAEPRLPLFPKHEVELLSPAELQLLSLYSQPSQGKHLQGKAL